MPPPLLSSVVGNRLNPLDLSLYLVLDPDLCGGLDGMVATAKVAAEHGVSIVQLRAPQWKKRQWMEAANLLKAVLDVLNVPLIINDHVDIALATDAAGVHVGQADMPVDVVRRLIGPNKLLGLSTSNANHLAAVPVELVDYIGVGPVYPTGTKRDTSPVIGLTTFSQLMLEKPVPVVAIGGIKAGMAAPLIKVGANGVAVVSAICGQADPAAATKALYAEICGARS
ncbi:thiamine phosphate synthase [Chitinimonas sp. BJB300]|uniref:thiamine phosphate synthase n=1 Tax=Chitinimonas sp. BJB300 TaxID=1559339 RepID=UPI000C0D761A|nr:thiamine phosphate synthase [Chitinimonas sp. BJB300]PHV11099.1 thiamine phosphate synthase [Chitinimonas sp. BJB300]TSJ89693.1 thiamine phosphate synthase [Chitinimonas sp. BJB300]